MTIITCKCFVDRTFARNAGARTGSMRLHLCNVPLTIGVIKDPGQSLPDVRAFQFTAQGQALNHRRDQLLFAFVLLCDLQDAPLEDRERVGVLLSFTQMLLSPRPHVFLRVQVRRVGGPTRKHAHAAGLHSFLCLLSAHDRLAVQRQGAG